MGRPEHAARLLGASAVLNNAIGFVFDPTDRIEYDCIFADVRAQLDETTFEAAWEAGRALSLEQAITEALSH